MLERACRFCRKAFRVSPSRAVKEGAKYCSASCYYRSSSHKTTHNCVICGSRFLRSPSRKKYGKNLYCSMRCKGVGQSGKRETSVECAHCRKKFSRYPSLLKPRRRYYCSVVCSRLDHPSDKTYRAMLYTEWLNVRRVILSRDGRACRRCGGNTRLHVHHVIPWRLSHSNHESNLITLCAGCHRQEHQTMRRVA